MAKKKKVKKKPGRDQLGRGTKEIGGLAPTRMLGKGVHAV
jgi:hypothetical protein